MDLLVSIFSIAQTKITRYVCVIITVKIKEYWNNTPYFFDTINPKIRIYEEELYFLRKCIGNLLTFPVQENYSSCLDRYSCFLVCICFGERVTDFKRTI